MNLLLSGITNRNEYNRNKFLNSSLNLILRIFTDTINSKSAFQYFISFNISLHVQNFTIHYNIN